MCYDIYLNIEWFLHGILELGALIIVWKSSYYNCLSLILSNLLWSHVDVTTVPGNVLEVGQPWFTRTSAIAEELLLILLVILSMVLYCTLVLIFDDGNPRDDGYVRKWH